MKPSQLSATLRQIATTIDNSKKPSKKLVARELKRVLASVDGNLVEPGCYPTFHMEGDMTPVELSQDLNIPEEVINAMEEVDDILSSEKTRGGNWPRWSRPNSAMSIYGGEGGLALTLQIGLVDSSGTFYDLTKTKLSPELQAALDALTSEATAAVERMNGTGFCVADFYLVDQPTAEGLADAGYLPENSMISYP